MVKVPDLGPVPQRLTVGVETARRLVESQFPQWAQRSITPVSTAGWDNVTFHLGEGMILRLPSAAEYALAAEKEQRWLPELASQVAFPIPAPLGLGVPHAGYPFASSVYEWIPGEPAVRAAVVDPEELAEDLAHFLRALSVVDASDGPRPSVHHWYRSATFRTYDETARGALEESSTVTSAASSQTRRGTARWTPPGTA